MCTSGNNDCCNFLKLFQIESADAPSDLPCFFYLESSASSFAFIGMRWLGNGPVKDSEWNSTKFEFLKLRCKGQSFGKKPLLWKSNDHQ